MKKVELRGYGPIAITPIKIKEQEAPTVDQAGNALKHKTIGERARSVYVTDDGREVPNTQVCKRFEVEGEEIIAGKFSPSSDIDKDNIELIDDNSIIYSAIERSFYNVTCDNDYLKDLVLNKNKSLRFPITFGSGWKIWSGVLTNWKGRMLLVACRGDLVKELDKYNDETEELSIEVLPQQKNMKKLVKAMAMV